MSGWRSPRRANSRSRRSRSGRSDVSRTTSASARIGSRSRRSSAIAACVLRPVASGMAVPRLREAPDQDLVAGLEEEHLGPDAAALERAAHRPVGRLGVAGADVEHDRDPCEPLGSVDDELREVRAAARPAGCRRPCRRGPRTASRRPSCRRRTGPLSRTTCGPPRRRRTRRRCARRRLGVGRRSAIAARIAAGARPRSAQRPVRRMNDDRALEQQVQRRRRGRTGSRGRRPASRPPRRSR